MEQQSSGEEVEEEAGDEDGSWSDEGEEEVVDGELTADEKLLV